MACRDGTYNFTLLFNCRQGDQATPPHTYASSERVVRAVIEAMPLGSGGSKCRDTARGRVGATSRPGAEGALQVAFQTGPLTTHFQAHVGGGAGEGDAQVSTVASAQPGFKMCSGTLEWQSSSTPSPACLLGSYTEEQNTAGVWEQGSQCALTCNGWGVAAWSVLVHIQFQEGLEFTHLGGNRLTLTSTLPSARWRQRCIWGGRPIQQALAMGLWGLRTELQTLHCLSFSLTLIPIKPGGSP